MFAKQTHKGRAIPLYFEILEYPIEKDSQNLFVIETIKHFYENVKCTPTLVFDRGFACPSIVRFLAQNKHKFVIRIKKRKFLVSVNGGQMNAAESFEENDAYVIAYGCDLRVIRSDKPLNDNDPWYLITNDNDSTREEIIARYTTVSRLNNSFGMPSDYCGLSGYASRQIALWFAILTCWLFERIASDLTEAQESERKQWHVSRFRYVYENILREILRAAESAPPAHLLQV
jgi:hypothetical protein